MPAPSPQHHSPFAAACPKKACIQHCAANLCISDMLYTYADMTHSLTAPHLLKLSCFPDGCATFVSLLAVNVQLLLYLPFCAVIPMEKSSLLAAVTHLVAAEPLVGMPQLPAGGWLPGGPGPELRESSGPAASWRRSGLCWPAPQASSRAHMNPVTWDWLYPAALHIGCESCGRGLLILSSSSE